MAVLLELCLAPPLLYIMAFAPHLAGVLVTPPYTTICHMPPYGPAPRPTTRDDSGHRVRRLLDGTHTTSPAGTLLPEEGQKKVENFEEVVFEEVLVVRRNQNRHFF